jgi:3D (Asp-Asp-Asp) domain-containing protein
MHTYNHHHKFLLVHQGWTVLWDSARFAVLLIFLGVSLWPGEALAFANGVELSHMPLVFVRDPTLADRAVVGIEAFPRERTVSRLLQSSSLTVRSSLTEGSVVRVLSTAYSSTLGQTDETPFITASGNHVGPGVIAANFLPFGTRVRIGQHMYTVWDRLNSRYDDKYIVDIWQPTRIQALAYGARIVEIEIVALP